MALAFADLEQAIRMEDAGFTPARVPARLLAMALSAYQRTLARKAMLQKKGYLAQSLHIALALDARNAVGVAGAGTGALPGTADPLGALTVEDSPVGHAIDFDDDLAPVRYGPAAVSSATATTLDRAAAGWVVNDHATKLLRLTAGPGAPRVQSIGGNSAAQLTGLAFTEVPTTATVFTIIEPDTAGIGEVAAVTQLPALAAQTGYLVTLDANGQPTVDRTQPLVCRSLAPIPLPDHERVLYARLWRAGVSPVVGLPDDLPNPTWAGFAPLPLVTPAIAHAVAAPAAVLEAQGLLLLGGAAAYQGYASIELRLVPLPPLLTSRTSLCLLPESAREALIGYGKVWAARRAQPALVDALLAEWGDAEAQYLAAVRAQRQATTKISRPWR